MTALVSPEPKSACPTSGYMPVQIDMLRRVNRTPVDLYIQYEKQAEPVLYHRAGCNLEPGQVARLSETGVPHIFIRTDEFHQFSAHLLQTIDAQLQHEAIPA